MDTVAVCPNQAVLLDRGSAGPRQRLCQRQAVLLQYSAIRGIEHRQAGASGRKRIDGTLCIKGRAAIETGRHGRSLPGGRIDQHKDGGFPDLSGQKYLSVCCKSQADWQRFLLRQSLDRNGLHGGRVRTALQGVGTAIIAANGPKRAVCRDGQSSVRHGRLAGFDSCFPNIIGPAQKLYAAALAQPHHFYSTIRGETQIREIRIGLRHQFRHVVLHIRPRLTGLRNLCCR